MIPWSWEGFIVGAIIGIASWIIAYGRSLGGINPHGWRKQ
jgi:hypothetical protein